MKPGEQLANLLKSCEAEEERAVLRRNEVESKYLERTRRLNDLYAQREALAGELNRLKEKELVDAAQGSSAEQIAAVASYIRRLRSDSLALKPLIIELEKDRQLAGERLGVAQEELAQIRVEKKRIERLLEERRVARLAQGVAIEEVELEESLRSRKKR